MKPLTALMAECLLLTMAASAGFTAGAVSMGLLIGREDLAARLLEAAFLGGHDPEWVQ